MVLDKKFFDIMEFMYEWYQTIYCLKICVKGNIYLLGDRCIVPFHKTF